MGGEKEKKKDPKLKKTKELNFGGRKSKKASQPKLLKKEKALPKKGKRGRGGGGVEKKSGKNPTLAY